MGSAQIDQSGALVVATACVLKSDPNRTTTGFQAVWDRVPNADAVMVGRADACPQEPPSTPTPEQRSRSRRSTARPGRNGGQPYAGDVVSDGKLALRLSKFLRVALELRGGGVSSCSGRCRQRGCCVMDLLLPTLLVTETPRLYQAGRVGGGRG